MINSHDSWSQLEEVWLGDIYPAEWYDHLPSEIRDVFYQITEITKQDLDYIEKKLIEFGIIVRRPTYNNIDYHINSANGQLIKPQICPRDTFLTLGNKLLVPRTSVENTLPWAPVLNEYRNYDQTLLKQNEFYHFFNGANVVRVGRDLIVDTDIHDISINDFDTETLKDYRVHWEKNGGHMDGCFAILKPGLILANHYFNGYERTFPNWQKIFLNEPTYWQHRKTPTRGSEYNGRFFSEGVTMNRAFNDHVIKHAQNWVGNYTETYFELNCLVINEQNVMMLGYNAALEQTLNSHGITVHWVPFRCRGFWDGGMHCITLDIRRQGSLQNYFPERG